METVGIMINIQPHVQENIGEDGDEMQGDDGEDTDER